MVTGKLDMCVPNSRWINPMRSDCLKPKIRLASVSDAAGGWSALGGSWPSALLKRNPVRQKVWVEI